MSNVPGFGNVLRIPLRALLSATSVECWSQKCSFRGLLAPTATEKVQEFTNLDSTEMGQMVKPRAVFENVFFRSYFCTAGGVGASAMDVPLAFYRSNLTLCTVFAGLSVGLHLSADVGAAPHLATPARSSEAAVSPPPAFVWIYSIN